MDDGKAGWECGSTDLAPLGGRFRACLPGVHNVGAGWCFFFLLARQLASVRLMRREGVDIGSSVRPDDELMTDPDHHAIVARRNLLVALALTGLAGVASCAKPLRVTSKGNDGSLGTQDAISVVSTDVRGGVDAGLDSLYDAADEDAHPCFTYGPSCACT